MSVQPEEVLTDVDGVGGDSEAESGAVREWDIGGRVEVTFGVRQRTKWRRLPAI
jgi:hypothetical protein